jgi:hypothetical protein
LHSPQATLEEKTPLLLRFGILSGQVTSPNQESSVYERAESVKIILALTKMSLLNSGVGRVRLSSKHTNLNLAHQISQQPRRFPLQALPIIIVAIKDVRARMAAQLLRHSRIAVACI